MKITNLKNKIKVRSSKDAPIDGSKVKYYTEDEYGQMPVAKNSNLNTKKP